MHEQVPSEQIQRAAHPLARGILIGLIPYLVIIGALVIKYLASVCANDLLFISQVIAVALWGVELLAGILCLFNTRLRSLAISLVITLLLSALLVIPLLQLSAWLMTLGPPFSLFCYATG
jgi:hypothetical protein